MIYAMVLKNKVISVVTAGIAPSWPPDPQGNPVTAIACDDTVKLGMIYDAETGEFAEYVPIEPEPTEGELIQAEMLLNQAEILSKQSEQDKVLAELLLNQIGG